MDIRFTASQAVEIVVPDQPINIANYLSQPHRVVNALAASSQIDQLEQDLYRLSMRPLHFMTLTIQPIVDLQVWGNETAAINVKSTRCELVDLEYINQQFMLDLRGQLSPCQMYGKTYLKGVADLAVEVELPPPFSMMPQSILGAAGNGLLSSVLGGFKQRLMHQLIVDYQTWVAQQVANAQPETQSARTIPNP